MKYYEKNTPFSNCFQPSCLWQKQQKEEHELRTKNEQEQRVKSHEKSRNFKKCTLFMKAGEDSRKLSKNRF